MSDPIINKVAESGLITLDLEKYAPSGQTAVFDLKDHLFMGMKPLWENALGPNWEAIMTRKKLRALYEKL